MGALETPQFKFEAVDEASGPQTIQNIAQADLFLVNYKDHEGKAQNRLVAAVKGKKGGYVPFVFQERISGSWVTTAVAEWFEKAFNKKMKGEEELESV